MGRRDSCLAGLARFAALARAAIARLQVHFGPVLELVRPVHHHEFARRDPVVDGNVIADQHLAGKPAPDSFLKAAEMLAVTPQRAVVIEDAISGVKAGAQGGFGLVIGVARKGNAEELKAQGAHIVVKDLAELLTGSVAWPIEPAA